MGRIEVQGIVSVENGLPYVQFRQLGDNDEFESGWQMTPAEAREHAQMIVEASINAVYDAALISWAKEKFPDNADMANDVGSSLVTLIRKYRADIWGIPDRPEDWRRGE